MSVPGGSNRPERSRAWCTSAVTPPCFPAFSTSTRSGVLTRTSTACPARPATRSDSDRRRSTETMPAGKALPSVSDRTR